MLIIQEFSIVFQNQGLWRDLHSYLKEPILTTKLKMISFRIFFIKFSRQTLGFLENTGVIFMALLIYRVYDALFIYFIFPCLNKVFWKFIIIIIFLLFLIWLIGYDSDSRKRFSVSTRSIGLTSFCILIINWLDSKSCLGKLIDKTPSRCLPFTDNLRDADRVR